LKFKEILDNLDMIGALTLEARRGRWGFILDGLYLRMSDSGETPGRLLSSVDVQIEQVLAEFDVAYRLLDGKHGYLDLLVGARYIYLENELNFHLDSAGVRGISNDLSNAIVDRAVSAIQREVARAAAAARARLAALDLEARVDTLRGELRTRAIEKILEEHTLRDIIRAIRNLTPAQRERLAQSGEIIAAHRQLARAVIEERVSAAVAAARKKAQQAVARARKRLAGAIDSAIRRAVPEHVAASKSWVDPFIGFRGRFNVTDKCYLVARGDIGGFGVGSDLTWNAFAALGYQWTRSFSTELGYRHLALDYRDGGFVYDTEMSGVYLGMTLRL
jgi:hypothetical protein